MIPEEAVRFLAHEARRCHDRDTHEAFCLLLPAVTKLLGLEPMNDFEAVDFHLQIREELRVEAMREELRSQVNEAA